MDTQYDGIILGAGHNSLILQAYLCQAGLDVVCLERRDIAGGGLATVEDPRYPGFLHNTHSFYHRAITHMPWYRDLDMVGHGARYIEPELNVALIREEGEALEWWTDFDKTVASFRQFSERDADRLQYWRDAFLPIVERILIPESQSPPIPPGDRKRLLEQTENGRLLLEVSALSPLEFVQREFEHPVIQAGLLFFNGLREVDLRCPGFGHHIAALLASSGKAQMCLGGAAALARALESSVQSFGGTIRLQTEPTRVLVEGERAVGVETATGERIGARHFIASGLNPHQTFIDLFDPADLPSEWARRTNAFEYNLIAPLFGLNLNLNEPLRFDAAQQQPELEDAYMVILGLNHVDDYLQMVDAHVQGVQPPPVMWGSCPTLFDPSQAPDGKHTAFMWQKMPYRLNGDPASWDRERERVGREMLEVMSRHSTDLNDQVIDSFVRSPLDVERTFPNMRFGDLLIGAFTNDQIGANRPFVGAGHYRGHVEGFYLCGSSSHPGGNITGLPGYNCAQVVTADLGLEAAWVPTPILDRLTTL
jgi:phytoene dehydrogenase-like protein